MKEKDESMLPMLFLLIALGIGAIVLVWSILL